MYTYRVDITLDNGHLLNDLFSNSSFSVVISAQDDEIKEREAAREAAVADSLYRYAQKFGTPPPRRVVPRLISVRDSSGHITQIEEDLGF